MKIKNFVKAMLPYHNLGPLLWLMISGYKLLRLFTFAISFDWYSSKSLLQWWSYELLNLLRRLISLFLSCPLGPMSISLSLLCQAPHHNSRIYISRCSSRDLFKRSRSFEKAGLMQGGQSCATTFLQMILIIQTSQPDAKRRALCNKNFGNNPNYWPTCCIEDGSLQ